MDVNNNDRSAIVTGASGHTGSFLVNLLADHGWHVVATDLPESKRAAILTKEDIFSVPRDRLSIDRPGVDFIPADLTQVESLHALFRGRNYDTIFHTASLYDYFAPFNLLERVNVGGLRNLLDACEQAMKQGERPEDTPRIIHWSTCGVYGQPHYDRWDKPANETAPHDPPNDYSKSKMLQEQLLMKWHRETHVPVVILRPAPIYGPYQRYGMFHIYHLIRSAGSVPVACLYPRSRRLRMPMVHVVDLVRAAEFLATAPASDVVGEAFNLIDDCGFQDEYLAFLADVLGADYSYISVPWFIYAGLARIIYKRSIARMRALAKEGKRPRYDAPMAEYITHQYFFSNAKIKKLGFKFKYPDMFSGTKETIDWYISNGWLEREKWEVR
jgi:dihydroflavonol-4-reductase